MQQNFILERLKDTKRSFHMAYIAANEVASLPLGNPPQENFNVMGALNSKLQFSVFWGIKEGILATRTLPLIDHIFLIKSFWLLIQQKCWDFYDNLDGGFGQWLVLLENPTYTRINVHKLTKIINTCFSW